MGAMFLGVVKRVQDEGPVVGEQDADATADEDSPAAEVQTLEPGTFTELDEGEDVSWSDPPEVGDNYETFLRNRLRAVAQSVGVLYEQLTGDYSQINDRTYRAARNEVLRQIEMLQQNVVIPQLCRPVWRWFYTIARETTLSKPATVAEQDAQRVVWVPQGHRHIHPLQDAQAERSLIRSGLKSRSAAALERGENAEEVDLEVSRDNARADSLGLVFDTDPRHVTQQGSAHGTDPGFEDGESSGTANGNSSD
jgi:lambda family phage portal protein